MYTVKEVANLLDLTEHTIRYYTDKNLVPNLQRDKNNVRLFDDAAIKWLICTKHLRQCGMAIDDIKAYISLCLEGNSTVTERYQIFKKQQDIAFKQLEEAKERAKYISDKTNHYHNIITGIKDMNFDSDEALSH